MASEEVINTLEERVRLIRINRPRTKNAFNSNVYNTITKTLNSDANNDDVVVTIITGTGDYYSSGFDVKSAMNEFAGDNKRCIQEFKSMVNAFINYPKLLIALVNGPAIGIAVIIAPLCDIVYATDTATFETPFLRNGLCAEGCSSYSFPRVLGRSKASEMIFLGKKMTAQEAYQFGFIAEVIPQQKLDEFTNELKKLGKLPLNCVKANKRLISSNYKNSLSECSEKELEQLQECFLSDEFSAGIARLMTRKSKL